MKLLGPRGGIRGYYDGPLDPSGQRSATSCEEPDGSDAEGSRGISRPDQVLRVPAGGVEDEEVARPREGLELP